MIKLNIPGFGPQMRESIYKGVLFPLRDAVVRLFLGVGVDNIVAKTNYSHVLAHTALLRSSE